MNLPISKGFTGFLSGVFVTLVVIAIVIPQYCDYTDRVITYNLVNNVLKNNDTIKKVEKNLLTKQTIQIKYFTIQDTKAKVNFAYVNTLGEVVIKFRNTGQMIFLKPTITNNKITWSCVGGSNKAMPSQCRKKHRVSYVTAQTSTQP